MKDKIARRRFLKTGGLAVDVALSVACGRQGENKPAAGGAAQVASAEFADRHPRLLPGCCAYSYNTYLSKGKMTYPEFLDKVVEMGAVGADMTVYWFKSTDPGYLENLRHIAFRKGIPFSGAACGASMVQASAAKRQQVLSRQARPHLRNLHQIVFDSILNFSLREICQQEKQQRLRLSR